MSRKPIPERWRENLLSFYDDRRLIKEELYEAESAVESLKANVGFLSGSILAYEAKLGAAEAERDALREERNTANNYILDGCGGQEYLDARLAALQAQNRELREKVTACVHALRSYQYGNSSTELAEEVADAADATLAQLEAR
jgi:chromosome segregation ATPase